MPQVVYSQLVLLLLLLLLYDCVFAGFTYLHFRRYLLREVWMAISQPFTDEMMHGRGGKESIHAKHDAWWQRRSVAHICT